MHLLIRKWKQEDIHALVDLTFEWGYETTAKKITADLKRIDELSNAAVFVAELDGQVTGRIVVMERITLGSDRFAEIHGLVVAKNYRRKGIGRKLIETAKEWSKQNGFSVLRLRTNAKRNEANSLYPALEFTLEKQQNVYSIKC